MARIFTLAIPILYGPRLRRKVRFTKILIALLALEILVALISGIPVHELERRTQALAAEKIRGEQELESLQSRLRALEEERSILVQTRSPELYPFESDKAIPINKAHIENIRFTPPRLEGGTGFKAPHTRTYSVFMLARRQPPDFTRCAVELSFFDRNGIQIADHGVDPCSSTEPDADAEMPISGQLFSFSFLLTLTEDIRPAYFAIDESTRAEQ